MKNKRVRSFIALLLAVIMLGAFSLNACAAVAFVEDVPEPVWDPSVDARNVPWYSMAVYNIYFSHVMDGAKASPTGGDLFMPKKLITRGEFVIAMGKLKRELTDGEKWHELTDGQYIDWAVENKLLFGNGSDLALNDTLTREEMAAFMLRFINCMGREINDKRDVSDYSKFKDEGKVSKWAKDVVKNAYGMKIISGSLEKDGYYVNPQHKLNRAEAAQVLYNYTKAVGAKLTLCDGSYLPDYDGEITPR